MEQNFLEVCRATVSVQGHYPTRITVASKLDGSSEFVADSIIISRNVKRDFEITKLRGTVRGAMGQALEGVGWSAHIAFAVSEKLSETWLEKMEASQDPIQNEYLRMKGPLRWEVAEELPAETQLLQLVLRLDKELLFQLAGWAKSLPSNSLDFADALKAAISRANHAKIVME